MSRSLCVVLLFCCACDVVSGLNDLRVTGGGQPDGGSGGDGGRGGDGGAGGDGGSGACHFIDDFGDDVVGPSWEQRADAVITIVEDGELAFDADGGDGKVVASIRTAPFDATDCQIAVTYTAGVLPNDTFVHFELFIDEDNRAGFLLVEDELRFHHELDGVQAHMGAPFSASEHRHWRVRHDDAGFTWSVSGDGQSWMNVHSTQSGLPTTAMQIILGTEILPAGIGVPPYRATFDDVAASPP